MTDLPLLQAIAAAAIKLMTSFIPQEIAIIAWAYAKLSISDDPLLKAISAAAIKTLHEFSP